MLSYLFTDNWEEHNSWLRTSRCDSDNTDRQSNDECDQVFVDLQPAKKLSVKAIEIGNEIRCIGFWDYVNLETADFFSNICG